MKFLLSALLLFSMNSFAENYIDKVIYGDDDRFLLGGYNPSIHPKEQLAARSVLAQIEKWRIFFKDSGDISLPVYNLRKTYNMCEDEQFLDRPIVSNCTAFLVSSDTIVTAGHCVVTKKDCLENVWVFDFDESTVFTKAPEHVFFKKENVFYCKELIKSKSDYKEDYAIIKLDRAASLRIPLSSRTAGEVSMEDRFFIIGHPMGLPQVLAKNVVMRKSVNPNYFLTVADTFTGNSGSPVINEKTGLVEGILIKGNDDLILDPARSCQQVIRCQMDGCRGEAVQRILKLSL